MLFIFKVSSFKDHAILSQKRKHCDDTSSHPYFFPNSGFLFVLKPGYKRLKNNHPCRYNKTNHLSCKLYIK